MLTGIDISSHQPSTIFPEIATAVDFAFVKVSGDYGYVNPFYRAQIGGARESGVLVGHYYYDQPQWADVPTRVRHFLDHADLRPGEPICLDVEEGEGDLAVVTLAWLEAVERALGIAPLMYTYPFFADDHGLHDPRLARFPIWYAWYPNSGRPDTAWPSVAPWGRATIWQYTAKGRVPGIDTVVDLNVFDGTREQFRGLGGLGRREPLDFAAAWRAGGTFTERYRRWRAA
jgi:lysozyme